MEFFKKTLKKKKFVYTYCLLIIAFLLFILLADETTINPFIYFKF